VSESEALDKVEGQLLWSLFGRKSELHATLLYKPFWHSKISVSKSLWLNITHVTEVLVMVDGLTGVSRCWEKGQQDADCATLSVAETNVYIPDISETEAGKLVDKVLQQMCIKEKCRARQAEDPRLIFRPLWLIEKAQRGRRYIVDAYTGYSARLWT
jgi:hypothetical protein